jgi:hypothetical protein
VSIEAIDLKYQVLRSVDLIYQVLMSVGIFSGSALLDVDIDKRLTTEFGNRTGLLPGLSLRSQVVKSWPIVNCYTAYPYQ